MVRRFENEEKIIMKCLICKHGETQLGDTTVTLEKNGSTIVFKHVPADVCDNCGEKYVDDTVTAELLIKAQEIIKNGSRYPRVPKRGINFSRHSRPDRESSLN
jgi:YgiT-type zinc finger domain-containing protein